MFIIEKSFEIRIVQSHQSFKIGDQTGYKHFCGSLSMKWWILDIRYQGRVYAHILVFRDLYLSTSSEICIDNNAN